MVIQPYLCCFPCLTSRQPEEAAGHVLDVERGEAVAAVFGGRPKAQAGVGDLGPQPVVKDTRLYHLVNAAE